MSDFLHDDHPLWARLGYASEADYLNAQANRAKDAKEQRAREAAQRLTLASRAADYAISKKMRRIAKEREGKRRRYSADVDHYRLYHSAWQRAKRATDPEFVIKVRQRSRERSRLLRKDPFYRAWDNARQRTLKASKRLTDPAFRDRERETRRRWWARARNDSKWVEKRRVADRRHYASDPEYRSKRNAESRASYAANREKILSKRHEHWMRHKDDPEYMQRRKCQNRDYKARKKAEKLAQQQRDDNAA